MAINCSPQALSGSAVCFFSCIPDGSQQALQTYLLAQIANQLNPSIPTSANALLLIATSQGNSFIQIDGMQEAVQSYLWMTAANGSGASVPNSPSQLAGTAVCFFSCVSDGMQEALQSFLLAQLLHQLKPSSPSDAQTLFRLATAQGNSFMQLDGIQDSVQSYLICQIASSVGGVAASTCTTSTLPTAAACFQSCISDGEQVAVQNYILCQLANTSKFGGSGGTPAIPTITNFNFLPNTLGNIVAVWDTPPAGATATELWTSPDGVNYSLNTTVPAPGGGATVTAPGVGSFTFGKARWISATAQGAFSGALEVSGRVCDWVARSRTNGAGASSLTTRTAVNTFDLALVSAAIDSQMVYVLPLVDSLIMGTTPLYKVRGNDPATNNGPFVAGDMTVNGLIGDGATKFLNMGVSPNAQWPVNGGKDAGLTSYKTTGLSGANVEIGTNDANGNCYLQTSDAGGHGNFACYGSTAGSDLAQGTNAAFAGFVSGNRTSSTRADIYTANSTTAFSSIGNATGNLGQTGTLVAQNIFGFALNLNGAASNFNAQRLSFLAIHNGLTSAQCQAFFNAVQTFRTNIGGGFV